MKKLIIIPAYNEGKKIVEVVNKIKDKVPDFDYIIINDGSTDETCEICRTNKLNVVNLPINLGIGGAVQTGYKYALNNGYDYAIQVDGDGQHDPIFLPNLIDEIDKGCDLCIGSRFIDKKGFQSSTARKMGISYFSFLIKLFCGEKITDPTSGFRACNAKLIKFFAMDYPRDYPEPETIITVKKHNYIIKEIPVIMKYREEGKSSITHLKSIYYMIKVYLAIVLSARA